MENYKIKNESMSILAEISQSLCLKLSILLICINNNVSFAKVFAISYAFEYLFQVGVTIIDDTIYKYGWSEDEIKTAVIMSVAYRTIVGLIGSIIIVPIMHNHIAFMSSINVNIYQQCVVTTCAYYILYSNTRSMSLKKEYIQILKLTSSLFILTAGLSIVLNSYIILVGIIVYVIYKNRCEIRICKVIVAMKITGILYVKQFVQVSVAFVSLCFMQSIETIEVSSISVLLADIIYDTSEALVNLVTINNIDKKSTKERMEQNRKSITFICLVSLPLASILFITNGFSVVILWTVILIIAGAVIELSKDIITSRVKMFDSMVTKMNVFAVFINFITLAMSISIKESYAMLQLNLINYICVSIFGVILLLKIRVNNHKIRKYEYEN